ncbi:hypothetical protein C3L33_04366, partial [Rhododendron williamsianum]
MNRAKTILSHLRLLNSLPQLGSILSLVLRIFANKESMKQFWATITKMKELGFYIDEATYLTTKPSVKTSLLTSYNTGGRHSVSLLHSGPKPGLVYQSVGLQALSRRCISTMDNSADSVAQEATASVPGVPPRVKFKRFFDKEAVEEVRNQREIPDIRPGYIIQLKVEVPDNRRRVLILKGIVIARRNAGLNTTFRLRRLVAGVGVESLFPLYSPNIKEIKVLDKKKVRRAKLYYLRDKMNALRK